MFSIERSAVNCLEKYQFCEASLFMIDFAAFFQLPNIGIEWKSEGGMIMRVYLHFICFLSVGRVLFKEELFQQIINAVWMRLEYETYLTVAVRVQIGQFALKSNSSFYVNVLYRTISASCTYSALASCGYLACR